MLFINRREINTVHVFIKKKKKTPRMYILIHGMCSILSHAQITILADPQFKLTWILY
jgi:hypothetical protein